VITHIFVPGFPLEFFKVWKNETWSHHYEIKKYLEVTNRLKQHLPESRK
jgi:hypothetical protein